MFIALFVLSVLFASPVAVYFLSWIRKKILKRKGCTVRKNTLGRRDTLIIGLILLFISLFLVRCSVSIAGSDILDKASTQETLSEQSPEQPSPKAPIEPTDVAGILDAILDTILSFSGEGSTEFIIKGEEIIRSNSDSDLLVWLFVVHTVLLCFLAPIAGGALLFEILANLFPSLVAWIKSLGPNKEKYYFSELNEKSLALARSISDRFADSKSKPVMIAMADDDDDENDDNSLSRSAQKIGLLCVKSDLLHFRISTRGKKKLILINEDEGANVQMLASLCEELDLQQLMDSEFYVFTSEPTYDYAIGKIREKIKQRIECVADNSKDCGTNGAICAEKVNTQGDISGKTSAKAEKGKAAEKEVRHKKEVYPAAAKGADKPETAKTSVKKTEHTLPIVLNVNGYNNLIKNLLDTVPLFEPVAEEYKKRKRLENVELNLTIIGLGKIGMEMLLASYWCGQILDTSLNITAISRESEAEFLRKIDYVNPDIMNSTKDSGDILEIFSKPDRVKGEPTVAPPYAKIKYLSRDVKTDEFLEYLRDDKNIEKPNYYFISTGSDIENIEMANKLCELLSNRYCMKKLPPKTVITYVVYDSELASVLNSSSPSRTDSPDSYIYMRAVGSLEEVYSYENVFMEKFIKSADNAHCNYNTVRGVNNNALQMLFANDYGFYSTIARVTHLKYKVFSARMWEASIFEAKSDEDYRVLCERSIQRYEEAVRTTPRTDELACDLAWLEHRRWVAFIRTRGFRGYDDPDAFFKHFKSQKSITLKRHLCLVEARRAYTYNSDDTAFVPDKLDEIYRKSGYDRHFKHTDYPDNDFKEEKSEDCGVLNKKRCRITVFLRSLFHKKG